MLRTYLFSEYTNRNYSVKPYCFGVFPQDNKSALWMKTNQAYVSVWRCCVLWLAVLTRGSVFYRCCFHPGQFVWNDIGSETVSWFWEVRTDLSCVIGLKGIRKVQQNEDCWFWGTAGFHWDQWSLSGMCSFEARLQKKTLGRRKLWLTRTQDNSTKKINLNKICVRHDNSQT